MMSTASARPSSSCRCAPWRRATTRARPAGRSPSGRSRSSTSRCSAAADAAATADAAARPTRAPTASRSRPTCDPVQGRVVHLPGPDGAGPRPAGPPHPACRRGRAGRRDGRRQDDRWRTCCCGSSSPTPATILVGDTPLAAIDPSAWRARLTWVPQRPHLFHGTVADNHPAGPTRRHGRGGGRGRPGGGADAFIAALPRGYATPVGEDGVALERRPAPAARDRAGVPGRCPAGHPRRGDLASRPGQRGGHPRRRRAARRRPGPSWSSRTGCGSSTRRTSSSCSIADASSRPGAPAELAGRDGPYRRLLAAAADGPDA